MLVSLITTGGYVNKLDIVTNSNDEGHSGLATYPLLLKVGDAYGHHRCMRNHITRRMLQESPPTKKGGHSNFIWNPNELTTTLQHKGERGRTYG